MSRRSMNPIHYTPWPTYQDNMSYNLIPTQLSTHQTSTPATSKSGESIIKYIQYVHNIISIYPYTNVHIIADCISSHKYTLLAQDIIMSNRFYCITKGRPNNIAIYYNLIILWNCNFNSFSFKNCELSKAQM